MIREMAYREMCLVCVASGLERVFVITKLIDQGSDRESSRVGGLCLLFVWQLVPGISGQSPKRPLSRVLNTGVRLMMDWVDMRVMRWWGDGKRCGR